MVREQEGGTRKAMVREAALHCCRGLRELASSTLRSQTLGSFPPAMPLWSAKLTDAVVAAENATSADRARIARTVGLPALANTSPPFGEGGGPPAGVNAQQQCTGGAL